MSKKIFLDAGHGGRDPGAVNNSVGLHEADVNFDVCNKLAIILQAAGLAVMLSRPSPLGSTESLDIDSRWQQANKWGADHFISVHVNAGGGTGAETFIAASKPDDRIFAATVNDTYAAAMGLRNRGVKLDSTTRHGSLGVLRWSRMPAILVELAFIDAPQTVPDINILQFKRDIMAESIAKGIFKYLEIEKEYTAYNNTVTISSHNQELPQMPQGEHNHNTPSLPNNLQPKAPGTVKFCLRGVETEIEGYINKGVTFARARQLLEALGYDVGWNGDADMVTVDRREGLLTTAEELHYLQQIVDHEARGEDLQGQILIANVVLNRVNNPQFPDEIIEVIKQNRSNADGSVAWQFTPASRPDFGTATPNEITIEAVRLALTGVDYSQGALWFNGVHLRETSWAGQNRTHMFDHGGHSFYV